MRKVQKAPGAVSSVRLRVVRGTCHIKWQQLQKCKITQQKKLSDTSRWLSWRYLHKRQSDEEKRSSAGHTVPGEGRRKKGTSCNPTRGARILIIKCKKQKAIRGHRRPRTDPQCKRQFSLRSVSVCGLAAALIVRWLPPLLPFLPPVLCSSLYAAGRMSTWSCQTWTRVHERAWERGEKIGFFSVISRSGTVSCTLVWGSSQLGARGRTTSALLPWHISKATSLRRDRTSSLRRGVRMVSDIINFGHFITHCRILELTDCQSFEV